MMKKNFIYFWILVGILFLLMSGGCSTVEKIHPDRQILSDETVGLAVQENYIRRVYISLLGRKPDSTEQISALRAFSNDGGSENSRVQFIRSVMRQPTFHQNVFKVLCREYLNEVDTGEVSSRIWQYQQIVNRTEANDPVKKTYQQSINKLNALLNIPFALAADSFKIAEAHRRVVYNDFYDEINMGSENFVTSIYTNFLFRYPTGTEEENGVKMVDGNTSIAFGQYGTSKEQFIQFFFSHPDYYEGQVRAAFRRFLLRQPNADELFKYTQSYIKHTDYRQLYEEVLKSDAYLYQR